MQERNASIRIPRRGGGSLVGLKRNGYKKEIRLRDERICSAPRSRSVRLGFVRLRERPYIVMLREEGRGLG